MERNITTSNPISIIHLPYFLLFATYSPDCVSGSELLDEEDKDDGKEEGSGDSERRIPARLESSLNSSSSDPFVNTLTGDTLTRPPSSPFE